MTPRPAENGGLVPSITPILAVNFVGTLGFSIVMPFMIFLVTKWGGNGLIYGVLASTYSFFQLIGAPILGKWSDRYGRRKILLLSQLGTLLSWGIFLVAFAFPADVLVSVDSDALGQFALTVPLLLLFLARAADGLTGGNVSVANAYLADLSTDDTRSKNFGRMAVSSNVGFVAGPALAGVLGATVFGEVLPVLAALVISVIAAFLIAYGLEDRPSTALATNPEHGSPCDVFGQETKQAFTRACAPLTTVEIMKLPGIAALLAVNFLVMLGFSVFYVAFPTHAAIALEWSVTDTGTFFAVLSLLMITVQGPVLGWISGKVPDRVLVIGGSLVLALGFVALVFESYASIYTGAALIAVGNGLMWPTFMATLSRRAQGRVQGAVQGLASSMGAAASIAGLLAGGFLYTAVGGTAFVAAAGIIALTSLVVLTNADAR